MCHTFPAIGANISRDNISNISSYEMSSSKIFFNTSSISYRIF